jgi:hypothetical protein
VICTLRQVNKNYHVEDNEVGWACSDVTIVGKNRSVHRLLVGKPEGKRPLGRTRCMWIF